MLFLIFGSSGAGKSAAVDALRGRRPDLAVHDFDELGVPLNADRTWRQSSNEIWLRRGLDYEARGVDLLLAGQTPLGEMLAALSAPLLAGISACLLDCDDETRVARLRSGGSERPPGEYLSWARWMRGHAADPQFEPEVIRVDRRPDLHWDRWSGWRTGDPRWRVRIIDTTMLEIGAVAECLSDWIAEEQTLFRSGRHPLAGWAAAIRST